MNVVSPAQPAILPRPRYGLLAGWHLLSIDAPTVAALWTWFIAASVHLRLPLVSIFAMAVAVWLLYAADRLLDTRGLVEDPLQARELEQRHYFHHRHRFGFLTGIVAGSMLLAVFVSRLPATAVHIYAILGAPLAAYFILIHATGSAHRLPKELAVGVFFAAAVFVPTITRLPALRLSLLPMAGSFAVLCSLNCLLIYRWEHEGDRARLGIPHPVTRFALRHLGAIATAAILANVFLALATFWQSRMAWVLPAACAVSTLLLLLLDRARHQLPELRLRASADLALLTPMIFIPLVFAMHP